MAAQNVAEFVQNISCDFCNKETAPSGEICPEAAQFFEQKAGQGLWSFACEPMLSFITVERHMSRELLRFLVNSIENAEDSETELILTLLQQHSRLHPPCRREMRHFYTSVFRSPLKNGNFPEDSLQDFFALLSKIKNTVEIQKSQKSSKNPPENDLQKLMTAFGFYLDILTHDFLHSSNSKIYPMLYALLEDRFVLHCAQIFSIFLQIRETHRAEIALYLALLAEIVRWYDVDEGNWSKKKNALHHGFVVSFGDEIAKNCSTGKRVKNLTRETVSKMSALVEQLPSKWLRRQLCDYLRISIA